MPQLVEWLIAAQKRAGHHTHVIAPTAANKAANGYTVSSPTSWERKAVENALPPETDVLHIHGEDHQLFTRESPPSVPAVTTVHGNLRNGGGELFNPVFVSANHCHRHQGHTFVHNGLPVDEFPVAKAHRRDLLFLGKLRRSNKGAKTAVRVARRAGKRLILAGQPTWKVPASRLPWWPGVRAVGAVSGWAKLDLLQSTRALLVPARWDEPFGLVLIEAMACGTPVIGTDRGALPEIIEHGRTGFICRTEEEMVEAIDALDQLSPQACREHVERHFDIRRVCADYETLYRRAIAGERW
ncbi:MULTISPECIES: glycosyltransferase [unclassified Halorhodospira]|uniref:glycosyltransferase n=1 Tax=unclassified Halorhodospira TaxID=2626748 RepID=UPI001EE7A98C|nr:MULTISPECIES: glycosyltransferase [unclassified Halorhodospira]MCG5541618.1 glycosyltransferase [Halorhodospira sp. M39old]MCG5546553.1 glycosyltransferase [Halorhodospira sp. M38]